MPPAPPTLSLAAFGKHPGWNDHLDDLGMDTPALVALKRKLYFDGVAANIDSGAWEKLRDGQRREGFAHEFLWRAYGGLTLGRLWSSRDGKGRGRYPMVVCVQTRAVPLVWLLAKARPQLEELERHCKAVEGAPEVVSQLDLVRGRLRRLLELDQREGENYEAWFRAATAGRAFLDHPALGPGDTGLYRFLYRLEREAAAWLADGRGGAPEFLHLRVPAVADLATGSLLFWHGLLRRALRPEVPWLLLRAEDSEVLDLLLGRPSSGGFHCLRAHDTALPKVTEVGYQVEEAVKSRFAPWLAARRAGRGPLADALLDTGAGSGGLTGENGAPVSWWARLTQSLRGR
jgi:hypothetical protein